MKIYKNDFGDRIETAEVTKIRNMVVLADMANTPEKTKMAYLESHIDAEIRAQHKYLPENIFTAIRTEALAAIGNTAIWKGWQIEDAVTYAAQNVLDNIVKTEANNYNVGREDDLFPQNLIKDVLGIELEHEKPIEDDREYFTLNYNGKPCKCWITAKDLIPNLEGKLYAIGYINSEEGCRSIKIILD